jgi:tetratricopeptide (TPR) repeat protein
MNDFPVVSAEMEDVLRDAREAGDRNLEARSLTALAEVTLLRDADVSRAEQLAKKALEVVDTDESRYDALQVLETVSWWRGRLTEAEGYAEQALEIAIRLERPDLESNALLTLAGIHTSRQEDERAEPVIARALALAEQSGSLTTKAKAFMQSGELHALRERDDEAIAEFNRARELFVEVGAATNLARTILHTAEIVAKSDIAEAEKLARDAIRILKPLEDRGTLCEVQRFLAEALLKQGKVDEAEMYALRAIETVGPQDVSSQASTKRSLALIRAHQGRDEEAEALLRDSIETLERTEYTRFLAGPLESIIAFLETRERAEEAVVFEERLAELRADAMPEAEPARIA